MSLLRFAAVNQFRSGRARCSRYCLTVTCLVLSLWVSAVFAEPLRRVKGLEQLLKETPVEVLVEHTLERGNASRGALLFHKSAAACVQCHATSEAMSSLGPNLATTVDQSGAIKATREYLIHALLYPSKDIRRGYESVSLRTLDGSVVSGTIQSEDDTTIVLRSLADPANPKTFAKSDIEARSVAQTSLMPEGLVSAFRDQAEFLDVAAYVFELASGGLPRATQLQPTPEQLAIKEDWLNLDHAGIIKNLKARDFDSGKAIFQGYCIDCHGADGNRATLPTARAFGTQSMKFGADPYRMFMTLTRGNGLMGPMSHLTPHERYEVVHYVREQFMKPRNPDYAITDRKYLEGLPKGTEDGRAILNVERDFGPALASQLERRFRNVLTVRMGSHSLAYDLHTMNQADLWRDGFLDLSETQHIRPRGEGTPKPVGVSLAGLQGWEWGHSGTLDYPREGLLPRGPLPAKWLNYRGYHLHGSQVIMDYQIDGRDILETASVPNSEFGPVAMHRRLEIGAGEPILLAVAKAEAGSDAQAQVVSLTDGLLIGASGPAAQSAIACGDVQEKQLRSFTAAAVLGDTAGLVWQSDSKHRLILQIPASDEPRKIDIVAIRGAGQSQLTRFREQALKSSNLTPGPSLSSLTLGGPLLWPDVISTVGYLGLQQDAYVLDTLTIPRTTAFNTWFRTTSLDFLSDGRMVVATHGGDVWIVSGIDDRLLDIKWKRFAAGLYEPMGVKVVNDQIYLTCKDRIVRLHDRDENGEADYYENFSAETDISYNFHAFNFDLQTDLDGNFYYAKGGNGSDMALPGAVIQVSADGKKRAAFSTGFRAPNGMGTLPGGLLTCSDNQGHWIPASKISVLKPNGFYGWVQTYDGKDKWAPDGGRIDVKKVIPPKSFDQPMIWMPQEFDNSSGGQIWVEDPRWGPLSGRLLHTSFGKGWLSYLMIQELNGIHQAAVVRLPLDFRTGIMRGRVNPRDGQVYVTGLQGWNGGGRIGLQDQGIQRVRYSGKKLMMVTDCRVEQDGLRIDFNFPLDPSSIDTPESFVAKHWNYKWQASYGSEMYSPTTGEIGAETLSLINVELSQDHRSAKLRFDGMRPVHQLQLQLQVRSSEGIAFEEELYWTIHHVPN